MPTRNLHDKPFDEETILKLEIFEDYLEAWIPTFVMQSKPIICIFDFFAGTGYDKNGIPGSTIRILNTINKYLSPIFKNSVKVKVFVNEFSKNKFEEVRQACENLLNENDELNKAVEIKYFKEDFDKIFFDLLSEIKKYPSLLFLDQNGFKFADNKYLLEIEKFEKIDFLMFISSSYFWRFGKEEGFKQFGFNIDDAKKDPYKFIHRNMLSHLRSKLPSNSLLKLYPFTLKGKKDAGIYGIIFGAKHPVAVKKFLDIAWRRNPINGEANFDIDDDKTKNQYDLFGFKHKTKIEQFEENIVNLIKERKVISNGDLYLYILSQGHSITQGKIILNELKANKKIHFPSPQPKLKFEATYDIKEKIAITWIEK